MVSQLTFISDEQLEALVKNLLDKAQLAADKAEKNLYKNVVDPFSAVFDSSRQGIALVEWLEQEKSRQIQKTLQNFVGEFHQSVIGFAPGWENLGVGDVIDLVNRDKKIIAEIKNKHNTMNNDAQLHVYDKLQKNLDYGYRGFTAYVVNIVPKYPKPTNLVYNPSERGTRRPERQDIRKIDGKSFYALATDDKKALDKLYSRLPYIIGKVRGEVVQTLLQDSSLFLDLFKKAYLH